MDKDTLTSLFQYHYWANHQLWRSVGAISDAQFAQTPDDSTPSIQAQLACMASNENLWVNYLWHGEVEFLEAEQLPTRASIRAEWDALEEEMLDYLGELGSAELARRVAPPFLTTRAPLHVWEILLHVVYHAVEQRSRICLRLQQIGAASLPQDFLTFAAEPARQGLPYRAWALAHVNQEARR